MSRMTDMMDTWLEMKYAAAADKEVIVILKTQKKVLDNMKASDIRDITPQILELTPSYFKMIKDEKQQLKLQSELLADFFEPVKIDWKYAKKHPELVDQL